MPLPTVPVSVTVLAAVEIVFTRTADGSALPELDRDVTLELSYAEPTLTEDQLGRLVICNATRGEYLPTTLDRSR